MWRSSSPPRRRRDTGARARVRACCPVCEASCMCAGFIPGWIHLLPFLATQLRPTRDTWAPHDHDTRARVCDAKKGGLGHDERWERLPELRAPGPWGMWSGFEQPAEAEAWPQQQLKPKAQ